LPAPAPGAHAVIVQRATQDFPTKNDRCWKCSGPISSRRRATCALLPVDANTQDAGPGTKGSSMTTAPFATASQDQASHFHAFHWIPSPAPRVLIP